MPENRKKGNKGLPRNPSRTVCPFLADPFEECLCRNMGSLSVAAVIRLCGGDFESCNIYRRRRSERETGGGRNG